MTIEELQSIKKYCSENGITVKQRLHELHIPESNFYYARRAHSARQIATEGTFIQLGNASGAAFIETARTSSGTRKSREIPVESQMTLELRTESGTAMRIQGSFTSEHLEYTFKRLPKLSMYVTNGSWKIDNNGVENAIRPLAIGRKNYLFCGNDASAVRASMIYSFIATCKACGIEPREWLEDVIRRIPEYENGRSDVSHLLPGNWKPHSNDSNQR